MNYLKPPSNLIRGQLSKYDFLNEQKKGHGLKIYPFSEHCQKAASYDITPTIIAMSAKTGMLETVYREDTYPAIVGGTKMYSLLTINTVSLA